MKSCQVTECVVGIRRSVDHKQGSRTSSELWNAFQRSATNRMLVRKPRQRVQRNGEGAKPIHSGAVDCIPTRHVQPSVFNRSLVCKAWQGVRRSEVGHAQLWRKHHRIIQSYGIHSNARPEVSCDSRLGYHPDHLYEVTL